MIEVRCPVNQFFDTDGTPLDAGYIYVGVSGVNPETSPQSVFWDKDGTIPAAQPIRTLNGYPSRDGAVAKFYTSINNYSITVKDKRSVLVMSSLNTNSGVFDELSASTGASDVGYDGAASGLDATDVQAAIDELNTNSDLIAGSIAAISNETPTVLNLFTNSAFSKNGRAYVSGTPTTIPNQETLNNIHVVVSGESLIFTASTFGNKITAPTGGAYQVIPASSITGGTYSCNWVGTGSITVNGVPRAKLSKFTLTENVPVTVTMFGEIEKFQFTRPSTIGIYEYTEDSNGWVELGTQATTSGTAITFTGIPSYINEASLLPSSMSQSSTGHYRVRLNGITTGYVGTRQYINMTSATAGASHTDGFYISAGSAAVTLTGQVNFKKYGGTWFVTGIMADTGVGVGTVNVAGGIALTAPLTQIEIAVTAGAFDAGSISLIGRA